MRKHSIGIAIFAILAGLFAVAAWQRTSATVDDKVYALANGAVSTAVFVMAAVTAVIAAISRQSAIRNYSIATAVAAIVIATIPFAGQSFRLNSTRNHLSGIYQTLAADGPPFPGELPAEEHKPPHRLISHGYWVADDRQTFEVYYHDGSNSFTMAYPSGQWEWRGNKYDGPKDAD